MGFLEAGATVYGYGDRIPCNLFVLDETLILTDSHSTSGHPYTCLVSDNPTIRSWAHDLIDRYREKATPIDARDIVKGVPGQPEQRPEGEETSTD